MKANHNVLLLLTLFFLGVSDMSKIQFYLAADNYSEKVLANMKLATQIIPAVGIEVPILIEQYSDLLKAIDLVDSIGVKYINIHDLYINDTIHKDGLGGYIRSYDAESGIQRDIISSISPIYKLFRHIKDNKLHIVPNDCTLINIQLQNFGLNYMQGRYNKVYNIDFECFMEGILTVLDKDRLLVENV